MEDLKYAPLPIESLVLDAAPGWKRVEFTPAEVRAAVEAGANLARANQSVHSGSRHSKPLHLHNQIYRPTCLTLCILGL